jgi:hypothetical protein
LPVGDFSGFLAISGFFATKDRKELLSGNMHTFFVHFVIVWRKIRLILASGLRSFAFFM